MRKNEITEENNMFFNYVCELKTTSNTAGTMVFGDLLQNCVNQRLFETYNAPEYERIQMLHKLSGLYSEAYENTALFFGEEPVEVRFFGVPGGDEDRDPVPGGGGLGLFGLCEKADGEIHELIGIAKEEERHDDGIDRLHGTHRHSPDVGDSGEPPRPGLPGSG